MQIETLRSLYLRPFRRGKPLHDHGATGFLLGDPRKPVLVSARHVFTALNNDTGAQLTTDGAPDELRVEIASRTEIDGTVEFQEISVPVARDDNIGNSRALWWDHPTYGHRADVAAVRFPQPVSQELITPLGMGYVNGDEAFVFTPTAPVSVVGFPFGRAGPQKTAIWTTCTVASEYGTESDLYFLVDGRTRRGQSGSPVLMYRRGGNLFPSNGNMIMNGVPASLFAGLYSGRIQKDADIGRVWKPSVVVRMVAAGLADDRQ